MKSIVLLLGCAALVGGVFVMADATQNRPDREDPGSVTVVELAVNTRDFAHGDRVAVTALWSTCAMTIGGQVSAIPEPAGAVGRRPSHPPSASTARSGWSVVSRTPPSTA